MYVQFLFILIKLNTTHIDKDYSSKSKSIAMNISLIEGVERGQWVNIKLLISVIYFHSFFLGGGG